MNYVKLVLKIATIFDVCLAKISKIEFPLFLFSSNRMKWIINKSSAIFYLNIKNENNCNNNEMKQTIVYFVFYEQWTTEHFTEFIEEIKVKINTHTTEHIIFEYTIQFKIMTEQWKIRN